MKVLMLAQTFEPAQGGGPRWTSELARGLAGRGHEVLVLTQPFRGMPAYETPAPNLTVRREAMPIVRGSPIFTSGLLRRFRSFAPDVVQTSAPSLADLLMPGPSSLHAPFATLFHAQLGTSIPARIVQAGNLLRLRREWSAIAVTSAYWREWLVERGVSEERIHVIPSTVSASFAAGPLADVVRGNSEFVFVGGLASVQSYKRFDLLIEAASILHARVPDASWQITVIGDGPLRAGYEAEVRSRGLATRITFCGSASDEALHAAYSRATAVVLPSSDTREGWGLVLAEALCCGAPVLLTDGIGGARTFGAAPGAMVVPAGDANALAGALFEVLGRGADGRDADRIAFGAQFHASAVVASYEAMYAAIIPSRG